MNSIKPYIIGIDIGGTKLATVVADTEGTILRKLRWPTDSQRGPDAIVDSLIEMAHLTLSEVGVNMADVAGVGVSCGGPLDTETGVVYSPPNLPGWDAYPLKDKLGSALEIPVIIENDANAGGLAEWMFGAGQRCRYMLYMTMGTGIGGGIVIDGQIYHGANDSAGEVGHQILIPEGPLCGCGQRGCLEALCSGPSIARRARELIAHDPDTLILELAGGRLESVRTEFVVQAAHEGDALALKLLDQTAYYMGWGIANLVNILNVEVIVLGTVAVAAGSLLLEPMNRYMRRFAMSRPAEVAQIVPAQLGELVGDLAAVALVIADQIERTRSGTNSTLSQ